MKKSLLVFAAAATLPLGCHATIDVNTDDDDSGGVDDGDDGSQEARFYDVTNLVTDENTDDADHTDTNLVNPWGLAFGPETFFWVANEGTSTSTLYDGDGRPQQDAFFGGPIDLPEPASMPAYAEGEEEEAGPTGLVFHGGERFEVEDGAPSRFLFATLAGTILGWSPDSADPSSAVIVVDRSGSGTSYTGLAITDDAEAPWLLAANFAGATIDVYTSDFTAIALEGDMFVDPELDHGYSPFGIHVVDGLVHVAYALRDPETGEEQTGAGLGQVAIFDTDGSFVAHFESRSLDAPWGVAMAPDEFGKFGGALLVGNFGDGRINAYDPQSFAWLGALESGEGKPIEIDGLWAIAFGNDRMAGESDDLYFTAGPGDEMHGVFGEIAVEGED